MTPLEILIYARGLIAEPQCWCQGVSWKPSYPDATAYCITGSVVAATVRDRDLYKRTLGEIWDIEDTLIDGAKRELAITIGTRHEYLHIWNDRFERTHAEVLEAFDTTIARLELEALNTVKELELV